MYVSALTCNIVFTVRVISILVIFVFTFSESIFPHCLLKNVASRGECLEWNSKCEYKCVLCDDHIFCYIFVRVYQHYKLCCERTCFHFYKCGTHIQAAFWDVQKARGKKFSPALFSVVCCVESFFFCYFPQTNFSIRYSLRNNNLMKIYGASVLNINLSIFFHTQRKTFSRKNIQKNFNREKGKGSNRKYSTRYF